ncbi:ubiquitin-like protein 7 [Centruroides sculpturatus]|uniref:ubiquitin-like protein 7 n=1 Tax=Centruroides sculpturatus TaxID=218467 RepID=UPI000C6DC18A|nr:ubiquitin-like protein 7 [Centruroides sculpturatus]
MATIYVSVRIDQTKQIAERHKLSGVNLEGQVETVKKEISQKLNLPLDDLELVCLGKCLKPEDTLESYGIKHGMTIHVLPKQHSEPAPKSSGLSQEEIQQLVIALRTALMNPAFRTMIQQLSKPEVMENIIAATPGLADDPIAIGLSQEEIQQLVIALRTALMNPAFRTMIQQLSKPEVMENIIAATPGLADDPIAIVLFRVVELHPSLAEAATHIAAAFHEEASSSQGATNAAPMISYSLDALSDEDEMESDQDQAMGSQMLSPGPITPAQLASALAAVAATPGSPRTTDNSQQDGQSSSSHLQAPPSPQLHAPPPTPRGMITSEMFNQAMQHALGVVTQGQSSLQSQLQQLRDMGISDDSISLRALEATGGDVHAALELIFGDLGERNVPEEM